MAIAIAAGLVAGKPVGIFVMSLLAVKIGFASLPEGATWPILIAVATRTRSHARLGSPVSRREGVPPCERSGSSSLPFSGSA